jgi:hypothetical protein
MPYTFLTTEGEQAYDTLSQALMHAWTQSHVNNCRPVIVMENGRPIARVIAYHRYRVT